MQYKETLSQYTAGHLEVKKESFYVCHLSINPGKWRNYSPAQDITTSISILAGIQTMKATVFKYFVTLAS